MTPTQQNLILAPGAEFESLPLAERVALEGVMEEALPALRAFNDADIRRLHEAGASQRAIAEACGKGRTWARDRLARLGLATPVGSQTQAAGYVTHPLPQNGDSAEVVVDAEVVEDDESEQASCVNGLTRGPGLGGRRPKPKAEQVSDGIAAHDEAWGEFVSHYEAKDVTAARVALASAVETLRALMRALA